MIRLARRRCSSPRDGLDPRLVHCLEPRGLHLAILVRDGADRIVPPAIDDVVRTRSDDDLGDQHLGERPDQHTLVDYD